MPRTKRRPPLRRNAPKRRLVGALLGGPLGAVAPAAGLLIWAAAGGETGDFTPRGPASNVAVAVAMLAVCVGLPAGLVGAVLARRVRTGRGAGWGEGVTAFAGALLAGAAAVLPLIVLGLRG